MKPRPSTHDAKQRTKYWNDKNRPPPGENWIWCTREMMESPAWRQLSGNGHKIVSRIAIEHLSHGGAENGNLPVTFDNFEEYGVPRKSIKSAIYEAVALGWIRITQRGVGGQAGDRRRANKFALSWLPSVDGLPSNAWKQFRSDDEARAAVADVRKVRCAPLNNRIAFPTAPVKRVRGAAR